MSPKKPYQKRLPTVLPPAQRTSPHQETIAPRPAPPPVRRPPPAAPPPGPTPQREQEPTPGPAHGPDTGTTAGTTPATSSRATPAPAAVPEAPPPPPPTPLPVQEVAAPPEDAPHGPAPRSRTTLALVAAALVGVIGGGVVAWQAVGPDDRSRTSTSPVPIDGWPIAGESRAVTEVQPDGDLEVTHWIHAQSPLDELALTLPELDGAEVAANAVEVTADGRPGSGPAVVAPTGSTYTFADATRIQVRYRMSGAVERSSSADGRGLATTTSLDVTAAQARDVRVVRSEEVLSLACAAPGEQPVPCGESNGDDQWRVELSDDDTADRVLAVVTIPS